MPPAQSDSRREYELRINRAIDYIAARLDQPLRLEAVAQAACFSPFHFHRIFFGFTGETVHDYIWRTRLEKAVKILRAQPHLSVTEIALNCGFSSSSNFAKALKKRYRLSASAIRNMSPLAALDSRPAVAPALPRTQPDPEIRTWPETRLAYIRSLKGYDEQALAKASAAISRWAAARDLFRRGSRLLGIFHDDPKVTENSRCRYDAAVTLPEGVVPEGPVNTGVIPGGRYAVSRLEGGREAIPDCFRFLYFSWLPESGFQPADYPPFAVYIKHPYDPPAGRFVMEIFVPVRPL